MRPPSHRDVAAVPELGTDGPRQVSNKSSEDHPPPFKDYPMLASFACEEDSSRILCSQPLPSREPWVTSQGIERFLHRDPASSKERISDQCLSMTTKPHVATGGGHRHRRFQPAIADALTEGATLCSNSPGCRSSGGPGHVGQHFAERLLLGLLALALALP